MKNAITVMTAMVAVEFILYTMCLCAPQWLVYSEGASQGLFVLCNSYEGFFTCTGYPAWMGTFSLSWMFLSASSVFSLLTLFTIRPALSKGKRAIAALVLNMISVLFCVGALLNFIVGVEVKKPVLMNNLGWSFYICCFTLLYAFMVSVALLFVRGPTTVVPAIVVSNSSGLSLPVSHSPWYITFHS